MQYYGVASDRALPFAPAARMDSPELRSALAEVGPHLALGSISPVASSTLLGASCLCI